MVLARPIIALIYQRGKFHDADTLHTAEALQYYAVGLVGYSCIKVLSPAFYAINRKWTPMTVSFFSIGLNLLLNWLFIFRLGMGHRGLALSTAAAATVNFTLLYLFMTRAAGSLATVAMLSTLARCLAASAPIALIGWWAQPWLTASVQGPLLRGGASLLAVILGCTLLFLGLSWMLGIEGVKDFSAIVKRKFGAWS
jgi:putative peptidoglycan lipid II flippase